MAPPKGQTNNPNGRPPKSRALTDLLTTALGRTLEVDGKRVNGKRVLARMVAEILTTGKATFPDGTELRISPRDWLEFVKWAYAQIDGPPKHEVDLTSAGEALEIVVKYETADRPDST